MKKLLFTVLLATGLLLPASLTATTNSTASKTEVSSKKQKKKTKKSKGSSNSGSKRSRTYYSQDKNCTYNGSRLYVGKRGGCYYYAGSSKQYVDRSYCSNCN